MISLENKKKEDTIARSAISKEAWLTGAVEISVDITASGVRAAEILGAWSCIFVRNRMKRSVYHT